MSTGETRALLDPSALLAASALAPSPAPDDSAHPTHFAQFYESDAFLVDVVTRFIRSALEEGDAAVVIATPEHARAIEEQCRRDGIKLARAQEEGRYVSLDAASTLSRFMVGGLPDAARFEEAVGALVARAAAGGRRVRAFGEMVALLWAEQRHEAAIQLEGLWNALSRKVPFSLVCGYPISEFPREAHGTRFLEICDAHSHVLPAESYGALESPEDRLRAITQLQQKATALEAETAERKRAEVELKAKLAKLAELDRRKDEFLAMLGHELRNPLSAVQNAVATARFDPARRDAALDIASRQAAQLGRLVDDLLDVARITQGRIALRKESVALSELIERAVEATRSLVEEGGHTLTVSLPPEEVTLEVDPMRLEQVLVNLLTNAAKYTEPGGRIQVNAEQQQDTVLITVRDTGIGISAEMLPRVFDLFAQASAGLDRAQGGLGIGLTLTRWLVELHGGRVEASSDGSGKGTEIRVSLPRAGKGPEEESRGKRSDAAQAWRARVLVVEDHADVAESMKLLLEMLGHETRVAHDGHAACDLAQSDRPDVMLVDIGLPGMDGYEVARRVRQQPDLARTVLVALTGYGAAQDRQRALDAGFDHHLVKPVTFEMIRKLVGELAEEAATSRGSGTAH